MADVTLLTAEQYLHPSEPDWYVRQILQEDEILRAALEAKGLRVNRAAWTDTSFNWNSTRSVLFRAVWDYTNRTEEFLTFLHSVSHKTRFINSLSTILWNLDKHYLRDLQQRGIAIPETYYIEKGDMRPLRELLDETGFDEAILKPVMSAGARHTYRLNPANCAGQEEVFRSLISQEAMILQPFLHSVLTEGEVTLMVMGGRYTHAIRKRAKEGDFRVQDDFGGTVHPYIPSAEEIAFAEQVVSVCDPVPFYARVDILKNSSGHPVVSELEAIEPELWFRFHPPSATTLAASVARFLE